MKPENSAPIGIFDSGIGGLTVAKAVMETLPHEHIIYFGDTARVPYGIKSIETIREYALQITEFLIKRHVKMILIACNTVSAAAEPEIVEYCAQRGIPVIGVVRAGAKAAVNGSGKNQHIGVIGTLATVGSGTYERSLKKLDADLQVYSKACPLLVPLAEEGWTDNDIARQTLGIYLEGFKNKQLDALILGCTHYPLFKDTIREVLNNPDIRIVDSAISIAEMAKRQLQKKNLLASNDIDGQLECYVTDKPQRFQELAELFLGKKIQKIEIVSLK